MKSVRLIAVTNTDAQEELYNDDSITILKESMITIDVTPWEKIQYIRYIIYIIDDDVKGFKGIFY